MSSLPQGWHGVAGTSKAPSTRNSGSSVPVTVRKKWNSPMSSNSAQTRLPLYKSQNTRQQMCSSNGIYHNKPSVAASAISQTKLPTPTKPSPVKEYKNEIEKLKKELSTIKAENSILKAKVRRVDDENLQKGRQIEKLRAEIKTFQKNESGSIRKSKESQELHSLRQKCLRLENALKDKELTIKKLTSELSMKKDNTEFGKIQPYSQKQTYQVNTSGQLKNSAKSSEKESISAKSSLSRASLSLKTEVTKLRDMIHKLEKENQELQQQAKLHCQEIRRLKIQMKSKPASLQASVSKSNNSENSKSIKSKSVLTSNNQNIQTKASVSSSVPKQNVMRNLKSSVQVQKSAKLSTPQKSSLQKNVSTSEKISISSTRKVNQLSSSSQAVRSKLPVNKPSLAHGTMKPIVKKSVFNKPTVKDVANESDLEQKVQEMRENIAAKKIQRSWREHQKCLQHSPEYQFQNNGKALTFVISSMKHHKLRKDKLNILVKRNQLPEAIKQEVLMEAIESISKKVWDQGIGTS